MVNVLHVRALEDNYVWLIRVDAARAAVVDPGEAAPVLAALAHLRLTPAAILCTHHHGDHTGGVAELAARYSVPVYGPARERIPALTHPLKEGDRVALPGLTLDVLDIPGHTAGHIAYHGGGLLFCGDTLFSAGCGRLFEGAAEQLHAALMRLAALPEATAVYCGHEYTLANLRFAAAVEPDNAQVRDYLEKAAALRARNLPTLPSSIGLERRVNPFLRAGVPAVRRAAEDHTGGRLNSEAAVFAALRRWKDEFRG